MSKRNSTDKYDLQTLRRALEAVAMLSQTGPEGVRVTDLALQLGCSKTTSTRLLRALEAAGYAHRLGRRYCLGPEPIRLSTRLAPLIQLVSPVLTRLASATGQTAHFGVLAGRECLVLARASGRIPGAPAEEVRESFPLWATSLGRAVLSPLPASERMRLLPAEPFHAYTGNTARTAGELFERISRDLKLGIILEEGEYDPSYRCYALPISGRGLVVSAALALSVTGVGQIGPATYEARTLVEEVARLSKLPLPSRNPQ